LVGLIICLIVLVGVIGLIWWLVKLIRLIKLIWLIKLIILVGLILIMILVWIWIWLTIVLLGRWLVLLLTLIVTVILPGLVCVVGLILSRCLIQWSGLMLWVWVGMINIIVLWHGLVLVLSLIGRILLRLAVRILVCIITFDKTNTLFVWSGIIGADVIIINVERICGRAVVVHVTFGVISYGRYGKVIRIGRRWRMGSTRRRRGVVI